MPTPESKQPPQLPRITSATLAMRPSSRRIFRFVGVGAIILATATGAGVAYVGEVVSGTVSGNGWVWGGVGAFVAAVLGVFAVPVARRLLISRAEVRLVEAASPLHPLLRRLMIEAPGTYTHSVATASLAEAGADAIGADPLVARVGAYYHDVGKLKRPCYFFENIAEGHNPHDDTRPSLSALIITSHVTDGLELAEEYELPSCVCDIIREHHGTSLVTYFFHKANSAEPGVAEGDFRYHGGRPTSREAALVMLADASEASVRALREPTVASIEVAVRAVLQDKVADGQLESSGLSDDDVERIASTYTRMLVGMLHTRCEYPQLPVAPGRGIDADQHSQPSRA